MTLPWRDVTLVVGTYVAVLSTLTFAYVAAKRMPATFQLFDRGIAKHGRPRLIAWERYSAYRVDVVAWALDRRWLVLIGKKGARREIPLPGDERDRVILATVKKHLPEDLTLRDVD